MAVLIIGIGYIGAALAEALLARGDPVVGLESGFSTDEEALRQLAARPQFQLVRGSAVDPAAITAAFAAARPRQVFLFAAQASARPDAAPAWYTEEVNLRGPRLVLDAAVPCGTASVVYASSFHVYGDALRGDVTEAQPYGRFRDLSHLSKCYAEKLIEMYAGLHGFDAAALRLGICYGVGPVVKRDYRFMTVPNKFCLQAVRGEPLVVHAVAQHPVAFVHLADAVDATLAAADALGRQWRGYLPVNLAGEVKTVAEVAGMVAAAGEARGLAARVKWEGLEPGVHASRRPGARPEAGGRRPEAEGRAPAGPLRPPASGLRPPVEHRSPASDTDGGVTFTIRSRLHELGFRPQRQLRQGISEVLDYFLRTEPGRR